MQPYQIYTKHVFIKDLEQVRILVTLTSRSGSQAISSENLVITITQERSHIALSNLYQACIYKRSQTSSDSSDLHLKVKVTGNFWWKSSDRDNSVGFSNFTKGVSIKDLGWVRILVTFTSRSGSQAICCENLVIVITQRTHVGFSNLYQRCIYKRSRTSSDSGELDLKVKVTGHFLWKSCYRDNSIKKSRRLLKFIPKVYL